MSSSPMMIGPGLVVTVTAPGGGILFRVTADAVSSMLAGHGANERARWVSCEHPPGEGYVVLLSVRLPAPPET